MSKLAKLFESKVFKKTVLVLGAIFYIFTILIVFNPDPFLKFGYLGVFVFNLFGPGTVLIPMLSRHMNVFWISILGSAGMALNDSVGWLVGKSGDVILPRSKRVEKFEKSIQKWGSYALFGWALIPFPYDFIAMVAGYLEIPYRKFVLPVFLARVIRFALLGSGVVAIWGKII
jgi:membrane protein YqaA with SNARE-associated domain